MELPSAGGSVKWQVLVGIDFFLQPLVFPAYWKGTHFTNPVMPVASALHEAASQSWGVSSAFASSCWRTTCNGPCSLEFLPLVSTVLGYFQIFQGMPLILRSWSSGDRGQGIELHSISHPKDATCSEVMVIFLVISSTVAGKARWFKMIQTCIYN